MTRLLLVQGDTALLRFQVLNADNTPVDLDLFDIYFTIKRSNQDTDGAAVWQGSTTGGDVVKGSPTTDGYCDVTVPGAATKTLRSGRPAYWDIQIKAGDLIFTPLSGDILVSGETTDVGA